MATTKIQKNDIRNKEKLTTNEQKRTWVMKKNGQKMWNFEIYSVFFYGKLFHLDIFYRKLFILAIACPSVIFILYLGAWKILLQRIKKDKTDKNSYIFSFYFSSGMERKLRHRISINQYSSAVCHWIKWHKLFGCVGWVAGGTARTVRGTQYLFQSNWVYLTCLVKCQSNWQGNTFECTWANTEFLNLTRPTHLKTKIKWKYSI